MHGTDSQEVLLCWRQALTTSARRLEDLDGCRRMSENVWNDMPLPWRDVGAFGARPGTPGTCWPSSSLLSRIVDAILGLRGCAGCAGCAILPSSWPGACGVWLSASMEAINPECASECLAFPGTEGKVAAVGQAASSSMRSLLNSAERHSKWSPIWPVSDLDNVGPGNDFTSFSSYFKAGWTELALMLFARTSLGNPWAAFHKLLLDSPGTSPLGHTSELGASVSSSRTSLDASLRSDNSTCFSLSSLQIPACKTVKRARTFAVQMDSCSGSVGLGKLCNNDGWMSMARSLRAAFRFGMSPLDTHRSVALKAVNWKALNRNTSGYSGIFRDISGYLYFCSGRYCRYWCSQHWGICCVKLLCNLWSIHGPLMVHSWSTHVICFSPAWRAKSSKSWRVSTCLNPPWSSWLVGKFTGFNPIYWENRWFPGDFPWFDPTDWFFGTIYRKTPHIYWENRWFPVKIFP